MEIFLLLTLAFGVYLLYKMIRVQCELQNHLRFAAAINKLLDGEGVWQSITLSPEEVRDVLEEKYKRSLVLPPQYKAFEYHGKRRLVEYAAITIANGTYEYVGVKRAGPFPTYTIHFIENAIVAWNEDGRPRKEGQNGYPLLNKIEQSGATFCLNEIRLAIMKRRG